MRSDDVEPLKVGCCRCSEVVFEEEVTACVCCNRVYCVRCIAAAMVFCKEHSQRVDAALAGITGRCMEVLFGVIDQILLEEDLEALPVPPRDQGH